MCAAPPMAFERIDTPFDPLGFAQRVRPVPLLGRLVRAAPVVTDELAPVILDLNLQVGELQVFVARRMLHCALPALQNGLEWHSARRPLNLPIRTPQH